MWRLSKVKVKVPYKSHTHATQRAEYWKWKKSAQMWLIKNWKFVNEAERKK